MFFLSSAPILAVTDRVQVIKPEKFSNNRYSFPDLADVLNLKCLSYT